MTKLCGHAAPASDCVHNCRRLSAQRRRPSEPRRPASAPAGSLVETLVRVTAPTRVRGHLVRRLKAVAFSRGAGVRQTQQAQPATAAKTTPPDPWECAGTRRTQQTLEAYIIHLQRRADRADDVTRAVQALSVCFSVDVLTAVDGKTGGLAADSLPAGCALYPHWRMTGAEVAALNIQDRDARSAAKLMWVKDLNAGELACTLSHACAWRRGVRRGATVAAVFEDDCTLTDSGVRNVIAALQGLRDVPWDIFRLGRSNADPLGPVVDEGDDVTDEVAHFVAVVTDSGAASGKRRKGRDDELVRVPILRATGS